MSPDRLGETKRKVRDWGGFAGNVRLKNKRPFKGFSRDSRKDRILHAGGDDGPSNRMEADRLFLMKKNIASASRENVGLDNILRVSICDARFCNLN